MSDELRLELRTKNNRLWHVVFDAYESVSEFCRVHDLSQQTVGAYINLTENPYSTRIFDEDKNHLKHQRRRASGVLEVARKLRPSAARIASIANMLPEDLFPPDLYALAGLGETLIAEVPLAQFKGLAAAKRLSLPPAQDDTVLQQELSAGIRGAIDSLPLREAKVIRLRFGINDEEREYTLDEVGKILNVSRARVCAIEAKAMRHLRHPQRTRPIRGFLDLKAIGGRTS